MKHFLISLISINAAASALAGQPVDPPAVEAALAAAWNATESVSGNTTLRQHPPDGETHGFRVSGTATYLKHGGRVLSRQLLRYEADVDGATYGIANVFDGETQWLQSPGADGIEVYKLPYHPDPADFLSYADWPAQFSRLRETSTLVWRADETIDGVSVHVLDVTTSEPSPENPVRTTRSFFSKEHGIPVKAQGLSETGRVLYEWTFTIATVNEPVKLSTFVFEIPANATLHDLTKAHE